MDVYYYLPFLIFIAGAYYYYYRKNEKLTRLYREKRKQYLKENSALESERRNNLSENLPWAGMESQLLLDLFGEPRRKREIDPAQGRTIWSYSDLFVYLNDDKVVEWKAK